MIIVFMSLIIFLVVKYAISERLLDSFVDQEQRLTAANTVHAHNIILNEQEDLAGLCNDWARWDDTYIYMENNNPGYITSNMPDLTFSGLHLNLIAYINMNGDLVYSKYFNLQTQQEIRLTEDVKTKLLQPVNLSVPGNASGIINFPQGPMLIAYARILNSKGKGEPHGCLIMGRYLDLKDLSRKTGLAVNIKSVKDARLPGDFQAAREALARKTVYVHAANDSSISGYTFLNDLKGKPGVILRVQLPREIYGEGIRINHLSLILLFLSGILLGAIVLILIEKTMLSRIIALSQDVSHIGAIKDSLGRLAHRGNDEISHLTGEINSMLDRLETYKHELEKSKEDYKYLSFHDRLTGLYNRAYFEEELVRLDTARQLPISIIVVDVNCLKLINDIIGHRAGDNLIMSTARVLSSVCRQEDIIARWGGDEFIIILPATGEEQALQICKRMEHNRVKSNMLPLELSFSLGHAAKTVPEQDIQAVVKKAENRMYRNKLVQQKQIRDSMLGFLQDTLIQREVESLEHIDRLKHMLIKMCHALDSDYTDREISLLAANHDLGEIIIPENILKKPGKLTEEEYLIVTKHPEAGYRIARSVPELSIVADSILAHHERWDGTGYPMGIKEDEIPLLARMLAIIDAYDAMVNKGFYKPGKTPGQAVEELERCAGSQFDPYLVKLFISIVHKK